MQFIIFRLRDAAKLPMCRLEVLHNFGVFLADVGHQTAHAWKMPRPLQFVLEHIILADVVFKLQEYFHQTPLDLVQIAVIDHARHIPVGDELRETGSHMRGLTVRPVLQPTQRQAGHVPTQAHGMGFVLIPGKQISRCFQTFGREGQNFIDGAIVQT